MRDFICAFILIIKYFYVKQNGQLNFFPSLSLASKTKLELVAGWKKRKYIKKRLVAGQHKKDKNIL
jgi:hypothetical protein